MSKSTTSPDPVKQLAEVVAVFLHGLMKQTAERAVDDAVPTGDFPKRYGVSKRIADAACRNGELSSWKGTRGYVAKASHIEAWLVARSVRKPVAVNADPYLAAVASQKGRAA